MDALGRLVAGAAVVVAATVMTVTAVGDEGGAAMAEHIQVYSVGERRLVDTERVVRDDEEWRRLLTPEQYRVARGHGTELACSSRSLDVTSEGVYRCVGCGNDLFLSSAKYNSGTGWPSFTAPVHPANVGTTVDRSLGMVRTEVHCSRCGAHLGHVFDDGPRPTGLRYCMNGVVLELVPMDVDDDGRVGRS